ncbi:hypothetical protein K458DRAFT_306591 [Lentithecium fluviatile CBS 122367]|uniref:Mucin-like protein n=1 Tax=Lentithecium fluviatile CBS 122367 TaxID=1168545 RepID=A0A6G1IXI4_9PLEO|nr:hypothetical protein K458DRAFT_306591 [Lentithecium fluviatile CBS 122367]
MKKKAKATAPCSAAEYESLPEPLQRKCFSSLERLRIAEEQARQGLEGQHYNNSPASRTPSLTIHRSITLGASRRRLRKAESLKHDHRVAQADARFFLSLPAKVQRSAFSREEQVLLAGRCDPSPIPRTPAREPELQRFADFKFDFYDDAASSQERGRPRRRSSSVSFASDVSPTRASFPRTEQEQEREEQEEQEQDTESSLLYLDTMSPPPSQPVLPPTYKRTMSLTSLPIRHSTSSAPLLMDPPASARAAASWHQRAHSQSLSGRRSSHTPIPPVFDAEATHYRDPEARKKLRMYLASPQKFDEAVEFGFPSQAGADTTPHRYQLPPIATDARNFSRDMHTFLRDDKVSFLEDTEEEDKGLESDRDSIVDMDSPVTPSSVGQSFRCHTRQMSSNISSLDSNGLPPIHPMAGRLNREMTLRMTLTRPDLRADEDQLYGWQGQRGSKDDPFALEELQLSDDMNGTKSPFYVKPKAQGNLVSRLFKRASKKGR